MTIAKLRKRHGRRTAVMGEVATVDGLSFLRDISTSVETGPAA